ncbi:AAA family ATPase [Thalassotalea euphylliae]|uniref:AAA family ATPase n=1 Tax=Thalassotalea euphylliae TaxID=1655234 RepID=A0A3E0UF89_9GAMM|nr:AAA family ATPase [Thalassotalea euphylliae]REL35536.1 AAA family ATPase [Thalassotalea euphylliae]
MDQLINQVISQVNSVVLGKDKEVRLAVACLLAKGHLLIEDLPGMGKTTLAQVLAKVFGLSYQRCQFTSDMLPSDVTGISIFDAEQKQFVLHHGPIFNQLVLADEINRASPKTQSALLEAMEEHQVSIDGVTHELPSPFFVIATQNPLFHAGTNPLPESQLDRFMMRLSLGFPDVEAEKQILLGEGLKQKVEQADCVLNHQQLADIQKAVNEVSVSEAVLEYIIALSHVSRSSDFNANPLSPRAGKALLNAAKAWAFIHQRNYLLPEDVQAVFTSVCEHRLDAGVTELARDGGLALEVMKKVDVLSPLS